MPRKKDTYAYRAQLERAKAQRRIKSLERFASNENISKSTRERAEKGIKQLRASIEATKARVKTDSGYVQRTKEELDAGLEQLREGNFAGEIYVGRYGESNFVTETEINKASAGLESEFTSREKSIFYSATKDAWAHAGLSVHARNAAILRYYGFKNLKEAITTILQMNQEQNAAGNNNPEDDMTEEQREAYDREPTEAEDVSYEVEQGVFAALRDMHDRYINRAQAKG